LSYVPTAIDRLLSLPVPDYEVEDVLVVSEVDQLRALAGDARLQIVALLRERAASTTELAEAIGLAKGTVAHHLKVLEKAGLVRVVRTRRVRALTESIYGRVARLFILMGAEEYGGGTRLRARLDPEDAERLARRIERLRRDFEALESAAGDGGEEYELVVGIRRGKVAR
jgi:DNA-binding transcriptional ArsR family regulator